MEAAKKPRSRFKIPSSDELKETEVGLTAFRPGSLHIPQERDREATGTVCGGLQGSSGHDVENRERVSLAESTEEKKSVRLCCLIAIFLILL